MKSKIIAIALFVFTAATVIGYPLYRDNHTNGGNIVHIDPPLSVLPQQGGARIEVVFVLDTTGSMSNLIQAAKEKIWSIASTMASAQSAPEISMGLVAYRDRGDDYVTQVVDLSSDLDTMYATLMDFQADGGGDGPESVNQALYDAVHRISWSQAPDTYQVVFLVGDAPPHMDYQDEVKYPLTLQAAQHKGIVINAIQCGMDTQTTSQWQQIAGLGSGSYFQVEQGGSAVAVTTPFDKGLAELSKKMDATRFYYGSREEKAKKQRKIDATDKLHASSSDASRARRAEFNASKSGAVNMFGDNELIGDISSGRVDLSDIESEALPEPMQAMSPAAQKALITEKADERKALEQQIVELGQQRQEYLKKKTEEAGGYKDSLDDKIYSAVREQAGAKGLVYEADAPAY